VDATIITSILEHYHWQLSLYAFAGIMIVTFVGQRLLLLIPTVGSAQKLNTDAAAKKMAREAYVANQKLNRRWGLFDQAVIFVLILPFCLTLDAQPWWKFLLDTFT